MNEIEQLRSDIEAIKARNKSVEFDKAWERSWFRRILLAIFTYLSVSLYMFAIKIDRPFLNAIVPTVGFLLSTLTLSFFRSIWERERRK